VAEGRGDCIECRDKLVWQAARLVRRVTRWNEQTARLFAADCAERVLAMFERDMPSDDRPRRAIEATRVFADGRITIDSLAAACAAARAAAWAATGAAARAAAWAAAGAAAWDAAGAAAWAAAGDATGDAAWAAARAAAWAWQTEQLFSYLDGTEQPRNADNP
ncbi:MAG TPA: hypothetical protein VM537_32475, partial [Anaerolineae bacterium]|nr:hypothetical protein [Anaerolineae bacterium]